MSEVPGNNSRQNSSSSGTSGLPQGIVDRIMENVGNISERSQSEPRKSPLPDFLVPHIILTRMSERVGKWAYTKISRKESAPKETTKERATLSKITDMLIDPKKIFAVVRLKLVDELGTFLVSHDSFIREKTAIAISEIARRPAGRQAVIRNPTILSNLINGLQDVVIDVRIQMARVLEILAHDYFSAKVLVENYRFLDIIAQSLSREQREILIIYLSSLEVLLLAHVNVCHAIEIDMIETLLGLLNYHKRDKELLGKVLSCLVLLCQDSLGTWKAFEVKNFLSILTPLLNDDAKEIHEKAASLIAFATITNYGKINGLIFIDRLLELANNGLSRECRLMSIKALTNIAEVPEGREELLAHLIFIEHINTGRDRVLKKHKNILLKVNNILSQGVTRFALHMDHAIDVNQRATTVGLDRDNVVFSPLNLAGTLAVVLLGSGGRTFDEIASILGFEAGVDISGHSEIVHHMFGILLNSIKLASGTGSPQTSEIFSAGSIFVQSGYSIRPEFAAIARDVYKNDVINVDFLHEPFLAQSIISNWVN